MKTDKKREVLNLLPKEYQDDLKNIELHEIIPAGNLNSRKKFFKYRIRGKNYIHLTIGYNLESLFNKTKDFNRYYPSLSCKPLFIHGQKLQVFAQEYFDGKTLEELWTQGQLKINELENIINFIESTFNNKLQNSNKNSFRNEIEELKFKISKSPNLSNLDLFYINEYVFPILFSQNIQKKIFTRPSNGDLAARNILIDNNLNIRIIDCEFYQNTHFYEEDWYRMFIYSVKELKTSKLLQQKISSLPSYIPIYFYLKDLSLNLDINCCKYTLQSCLSNIIKEANKIIKIENSKSILISEFLSLVHNNERNKDKVLSLNEKLYQQNLEFHDSKSISKKEIDILKDKIHRLQNSFSYIITHPLRFFRRSFIWIKEFFNIFKAKKYSKQNTFISNCFEFDNNLNSLKLDYSSDYFSKNKTLIWLIPDFQIGSGGHTTIFRIIFHLENLGIKSNIYICGNSHFITAKKASDVIRCYFFKIHANVYILNKPQLLTGTQCPIISTSFETCYYSRAIISNAPRFYFVQDFEPDFSPKGSFYYLANETYKFGFKCITAGEWLASKISKHGASVCGSFNLAADKNIFFPSTISKSKSIKVAVYTRKATPRRMSEVIVLGLNLLQQQNVKFEVHFFGESINNYDIKFPFKTHGVLSPVELSNLYRTSLIGCALSSTNYSLVPLEMMACGLPVLEFSGDNTTYTYPPGSVSVADPTPVSICNNLRILLSDDEKRLSQTYKGLEYINSLDWEQSAKSVFNAITSALN